MAPTIAARVASAFSRCATADRPGKRLKAVADELMISEQTVKSHTRNILSKLGANDRTHAVAMAIKRGLITV
jgi:DNA-binding NarL/FixJ family response regulator